jgi:hypothetical protein
MRLIDRFALFARKARIALATGRLLNPDAGNFAAPDSAG